MEQQGTEAEGGPPPPPPSSSSWTGDVWIEDSWTEEERARAEAALDAVSSSNGNNRQPSLSRVDPGGGDDVIINNSNNKQRGEQRTGASYREFRRNASTNWNAFYNANGTSFFKDRHYLHKAFPNEFAWLYPGSSECDGAASNVDNAEGSADGNDYDGSNDNDGGGSDEVTIVEIGCGVGNAVLPLVENS